MPGFIHGNETPALWGGCFEAYRDKGCGFLEAVFQECLERERGDRNIPFNTHPQFFLEYKWRVLKHTRQSDFIRGDKIIREIKAVSKPVDEPRAQMHNDLKTKGLPRASAG